jgi:hypothetical protein
MYTKSFATAAFLMLGAATPYSIGFQGSTPTIVENSATCAEAGGTCREAGCRNGDQSCAVLTSGTVCLDHGGPDEPKDPVIVAGAS